MLVSTNLYCKIIHISYFKANLTEDSDTAEKVLDVLNVTVEKVTDKIFDSYSVTGDKNTKMHGLVAKKKEEDEHAEKRKKEENSLEEMTQEEKKQVDLPATNQRS